MIPVVSYILVSEFDILKGSTLKASYPTPIPNYDDNFFSNLMLPEGAHHHSEDTTIFLLNRENQLHATTIPSTIPTPSILENKKQNTTTPHPLVRGAILKYDHDHQDWIRDDDSKWDIFSIEQDEQDDTSPQYTFRSTSTSTLHSTPARQVPIHSTLQYSRLSPNFASIYDTQDEAIGLLFKSSSDLLRFETLLMNIHAIQDTNDATAATAATAATETKETDITTTTTSTVSDATLPFLYCLNLVRTKKDNTVTRGAVVKAIAICSPYPFFGAFKRLLTCMLDAIFKQGIDILPALFRSMNQSIPLHQMPPSYPHQRSLLRSAMVTNGMGVSDYVPFTTAIGPMATSIRIQLQGDSNMTVPINLPRYLDSEIGGDEVASLIQLIKIFRKEITMILDAVLHNKRILFVGHMSTMLSSDVCNAVLATCKLVAPLTGIITRCYPYANLTDLSFLDNKDGYIAGVR